MKTIKTWGASLEQRQLIEICRDLKSGQLMIYPTDTIYAIGCDAFNHKAVEKLCKLKGINPEKTNLSIICKDISQAAEYAKIDNRIFRIMRDNTPGPFTFLLKASSSLPKIFKGRKTVGIRIPDCQPALQIVSSLGNPVLTTSIEFEDDDYASNPDLITERYYNSVDMVIDADNGNIDYSTIIDCTGDDITITRQGKGILK